MAKAYFFLLFFFLSFKGHCQTSKLPWNVSRKINRTKYSLRTRLGFYPFRESNRITVVSFDKEVDSTRTKNARYYVPPKNIYRLPRQSDTICFSKLAQTVSLNICQVDTLTDILYNTCARWTYWEFNSAMCYQPHNAILFFDKNDKILDYVEICFDCSRMYFSNKKIQKFEQCDFVIKDLKKYFTKLGLKVSGKEFESETSR